MKKFSTFVLAVLITGIAFGQEVRRQKIKRITQANYNLEWYQTQKKLWKEEVDKNPKSEEAWWNYYEAFRGELHKSGGNPFTKESPAMKIVNEMEKHIPNTFTFYHCKANQLGKEKGFEKYMIKAYELEPNNPLTYENLIVYYEMSGDLTKRKEIVNKLYTYGKPSVGLLNQGFNLLNTAEKNGILITNGDIDTYPLWILQDVFEIRKDVTVVNRWMIKDEAYLKIILKRADIAFNLNEIKPLIIKDPAKFTPKHHTKHTQKFIEYVTSKSKRKLYLAQTAYQAGLYGLEQNFYNVGLAFQYSTKDFDNVAITQRNFTKRYKMDYILNAFYKETNPDHVKLSAANYAPGLLTIYKHARQSENYQELNWAKKYLVEIAKNVKPGMAKYINNQLNQD